MMLLTLPRPIHFCSETQFETVSKSHHQALFIVTVSVSHHQALFITVLNIHERGCSTCQTRPRNTRVQATPALFMIFFIFFVCSQSELYENQIGQERIEHMAQILSKIAAQVKDEGVLPQRLFWGERVVEGAEPVVAGLGRRV